LHVQIWLVLLLLLIESWCFSLTFFRNIIIITTGKHILLFIKISLIFRPDISWWQYSWVPQVFQRFWCSLVSNDQITSFETLLLCCGWEAWTKPRCTFKIILLVTERIQLYLCLESSLLVLIHGGRGLLCMHSLN
jgi:hypothetical protein